MRNYPDFYIDGRWTPARDGFVSSYCNTVPTEPFTT